MNRQSIRIAAGANLVAGCLLLQGCGMFGKKTAEQPATTVPEVKNESTVVEPTPVPSAPVETPIELPTVQSSTPYTIQRGDTVSAIAYRFGLRWQDVVAVNPGIEPTKLRVGQTIQLPGVVDVSKARHVAGSAPKVKSSAPKTKIGASKSPAISGPTTAYVVKSGDSLSLIAHKHGVKVAAIREANGLKSDRIVVGQKLKIPGATKKVSEAKSTHTANAKASAPKASAEKKTVAAGTPSPAATTPPPAVTPTTTAPAETEAAPAPTGTAPTTAAPAAPAADANTQTYTVKEGEDLYAVAIRWGVSPSDLKALNNLTSTELKAGTVLKIPSAQ